MTRDYPRGRLLALLAIAVVVIAGAVTMSLRLGRGHAATPPHFGVLEKAASPVPRWAVHGYAATAISDPSTGRLAFSRKGNQYFVAEAKGTICFFIANDDGLTSVNTCETTDDLSKSVMYISAPKSDGTMDIAGVVEDGFTSATVGSSSTDVLNNVFTIDGVRISRTLSVTGPAGERVIDIGPQIPPSSSPASGK